MTTFIVNRQELEVRYDINGVDISGDFIGNTSHGMDTDDDGRYVASQEDYDWWVDTIAAHVQMDANVEAYKEKFSADDVDQVVVDWASGDYETLPGQVALGLERTFGPLG